MSLTKQLVLTAVAAGIAALLLYSQGKPRNDTETPMPLRESSVPERDNAAGTGSADADVDSPSPVGTEPATGTATIWDELASGPLWKTLEKHWPRAMAGDADSMYASYTIISSCLPYRRRFEGKDIAEVHAEFATNNDPELIELNEQLWRHCKPIYSQWQTYSGWRSLLGRAAELGQPLAMTQAAARLVRAPETLQAGVDLIYSALSNPDPVTLLGVADVYTTAGYFEESKYAWLLAACNLGLDCSPEGPFMKSTCGPFSQTCGVHESVSDYALRTLGDYGYQLAVRRANEITSILQSGRVADLDLEGDLREKLKD